MSDAKSDRLARMYANRFSENQDYRNLVWKMLAQEFFRRWVPPESAVLDLGTGYGQFINNVRAARKYALDLNPDSRTRVHPDVTFFLHDCATPWPVAPGEIDVVFTSNFLEHLPDKAALTTTLQEAWKCLRPGGHFIALGPNIRYLAHKYWDFFDHHIPLSEASLGEALFLSGFDVETVVGRFLPYTMVNGPKYPLVFLRLYLAMPWAWRVFGAQFLLVARKVQA